MSAERHFGKVVENADPQKLGRLKVQVDAVLEGQPLGGKDAWIPASWPFAGKGEGFYMVPLEGSLVEVLVEEDRGRAAAELSTRWRGVQYTDNDGIPEEFRSDPTARGGMKVGGMVLLFDRTKGILTLISAKVQLGEEDCTHPLMRGDTYNTQLDLYLTAEGVEAGNASSFWAALKGALETWAALTPGIPATTDMLIAFANVVKPAVDALVAGAAAWTAAINAFKAAKVTWLSTKCKTE